MGLCNSNFSKEIETQERYVRHNLIKINNRHPKKKYTNRQIKKKLRQEYHGRKYCDDVIPHREWKKLRS